MTAVGYLPGDRWLVAGPHALVVVGGGATGALRWWPRVRDGAGPAELVELLHEQGLLTGDVPVALLGPADGALRVLVRGALEVVVSTAHGPVTVTGAGLLTWSERLVPAATGAHVTDPGVDRAVDGAEEDSDDPLPGVDELLPMPAGVVQAGLVCWQWDAGAAVTSTDPEPPGAPADPGAVPAGAVPAGAVPAGAVPAPAAPQPDPAGDDAPTLLGDDLEQALAGPDGPDDPDGPDARDEAGEPPAPGADDEPPALPGHDAVERTLGLAAVGFVPPPFPGAAAPIGAGPVGARPIDHVPGVPAASPAATPDDGPLPPLPPFVPLSTTLPPVDAVPGDSRPDDDRSGDIPARHGDLADAAPTGLPPAPTPAPTPAAPTPAAAGRHEALRPGDHDGHTVLAESLPADHRPPQLPPEPGPGQVYAVRCPLGHPNAPHTGDCRVCGSPVPPAAATLIDRPLLARLRMSTGALVDVDRRVVVGRAPSVSRVGAGDVPHLVTVPSPHQDVSRSHVEVRVEDWHVLVTDLHSTNGTEVHAPGRPVQVLRGGEAVVVEIGWRIDLGDGADFVVEGG